MITNNREELWNRVNAAKEYVFGEKFRQFKTSSELSNNLLLSDKVLDQFSLGNFPDSIRKPNSHLSLLAMVIC
jgi:prephenate dehydrogenase (NADP+)